MDFKKFFNKICVVLFFISFLVSGTSVKANDNSTEPISFDNLHEISGGLKLNCTNNNNVLNVKLDSKNLKKGYYTSTIYKNYIMDLSDFGMMSFQLENKSQSGIRLNFIMELTGNIELMVSNNKPLLLKQDNSNLIEIIKPSYGSFEIPKGFKGEIYIPFNSLGKQGLDVQDKQYEISQIASFGIISTVKENEQSNFDASKFLLINKNSGMMSYGNLKCSIDGDDRVQIPVVGESIAQYKANVYNENGKLQHKKITYGIENPQHGIEISNDGLLRITKRVDVDKIRIYALIDNKFKVSKDIQLFKSWTLSAREVDGTSKSVPTPNEVPPLIGNFYKFILSNDVLNTIRIIFTLFAVSFILLFIWWKKKFNGNY